MEQFIQYYKKQCLINKIDYNLITTDKRIDYALSAFLNKRKKAL